MMRVSWYVIHVYACVKLRARVQSLSYNTMTDESQTESVAPSAPPQRGTFFGELFRFAIITLFIVLPIRIYIAQPFIVSGSSMDPTFENGEYLIVDELTYRLEDPQRGDVIIFRYPQDPSKFFIKRIIGLPSETVTVRDNSVMIENEEHPEGFMLDETYLPHETHSNMRVTLSDDEYFVMGDNRPASSDSRIWGPLPREMIIGRAFLRLLPVTKAQVLPGMHQYDASSEEEAVPVTE